ncbi:MAG: polyribonucleotide nucleotidyltransferase, partial [Bacteriovoracales bacterium]|nr:polyribonucleotide nucleotidyltransferase [Bacteriovoracales bacterium]
SESDLEVVVSASNDAILMVEGEAREVPEAEMLEALEFAHDHIKKWCELVEKMAKEVGRPKRDFVSSSVNETLSSQVEKQFSPKARDCLGVVEKLSRQKAVSHLVSEVGQALAKAPQDYGLEEEKSDFAKEAYKAVDDLLYKMMREDILAEGKRIGGRGLDEVRSIETEVDILKAPHGSALFTRGETQVMSTVTIGGSEGDQMVDNILGLSYQKFYLHYFFPPFCVGEARGVRGVGRRELGHGNLAERALKNMFDPLTFPYTLRVMCEVLESNGSSSMGSVCSGSLALMDAGVPLSSPVAGVAMGLVKEGDRFQILTDILGDEDHLGDMDFKVAGSSKGITAIQMDIKIAGITRDIFTRAMEQAKTARLHILSEMNKTMEKPRESFKAGVPTIKTLKIPPDKIGALIGPGGKNIKKLQEENGVKIEVEEDGTVRVLGTDDKVQDEVIETVELQINGPKIGTIYPAEAVTIKEYGVFVDIAPGVSGLVHISEVAHERIKDIEEYVSEGDKFDIKVIEVDKFGRLKLSAKEVRPLEKKKA